jgi:hypothetical protein
MSVDECYVFKHYAYPTGIFDASIDATYILYMYGSNRIANILEQLETYHPTKKVYLLMNKGYKQCKKELTANSSKYDLIDATIHVLNHAQTNGYGNVLVLEDDFIFSPDITTPMHVQNVNHFLLEHKNRDFIYQLGGMPFLSIPRGNSTYLSIGAATHANVYSRSAAATLIKDYNENKITTQIDMHIILQSLYKFNTYSYYKPLCYQVFTNTDNKNEWVSPGPFKTIQMWFINFFLWLFGIDTRPEPGTSIIYALSKLAFVALVALAMYCVYKVL